MGNPFIFGQIPFQENFCQRAESSKIEGFIKNGKSIYLTGRHKIGKTSLVLNLSLKDHYLIHIDFKKSKSKVEALHSLVKAILSAEEKATNPDFTKLFVKFKDYRPNMYLDGLDKMNFKINPEGELDIVKIISLIDQIDNKKPLIFLDNIQYLFNQSKEMTKSLIEELKNHQIIVCESLDLYNEKLQCENLVKKFSLLNLEEIPVETYFKFVSNHLKSKDIILSKDIFETAITQIGTSTSDRQLFFKVFYDNFDTISVSNDHLSSNMISILNQYQDLYEMFMEDLTDKQRAVLLKLASENDVKMYSKQTCDELGLSSTNSIIKILQSLINKKLIYKKDSSYIIFSPYFRFFLQLR